MKLVRNVPDRTSLLGGGLARPEHSNREIDLLAKDLWKAMQGGDGDKMYVEARRFYRKMVEHVREEDSPSGWYGEVERIAPTQIHRLEKLRAHHLEILANLQLICDEVDDDLEGVRALVDETLDLVARHESEEELLIAECYFRDEPAVD